MKKRGQLKLSFGMIFSIFLIVIFLAFAVYAIIKFINLQQTIQIETFKNDLQEDIDAMWQSQQGSREVEYVLPKKINGICFREDDYNNLELDSEKPIGADLEHINITAIISEDNPYCIANVDGKISMTLIKDYGESLVKIT